MNRPSLYAVFGNKESLFKKALKRYFAGPSVFMEGALNEPTAKAVVEKMWVGVVNAVTAAGSPRGCLWVQAMASGGDLLDPVHQELQKYQAAGEGALRKRLWEQVSGLIPISWEIWFNVNRLLTISNDTEY